MWDRHTFRLLGTLKSESEYRLPMQRRGSCELSRIRCWTFVHKGLGNPPISWKNPPKIRRIIRRWTTLNWPTRHSVVFPPSVCIRILRFTIGAWPEYAGCCSVKIEAYERRNFCHAIELCDTTLDFWQQRSQMVHSIDSIRCTANPYVERFEKSMSKSMLIVVPYCTLQGQWLSTSIKAFASHVLHWFWTIAMSLALAVFSYRLGVTWPEKGDRTLSTPQCLVIMSFSFSP